MPETDLPSPFIYRHECAANIEHLKDAVDKNSKTNDKILKILQGNGEGGLLWKVNTLMLRNQWADKLINIVLTIVTNLLILYLTGVLNI